MSQVHVKFLSNVQKDFYLFISEVDSSLLSPVTPLPHHLNLIKEKDIYMRAALQLLDQKNLVPTALDRGGAINNVHVHQDPPSSSTKNPHHDENDMHDVIRLGYLKKGAKSGTINIPGSGTYWKRKYVEVRHGLFCYDDYHGGTIYIGNSDLDELTRTDNFHRRYIKLNVETCHCRMLPAKDGHSRESRVFEIAIVDGAKRLWMASSIVECREWVKAVNAAMVGGVYRSNASLLYSRNSRASSGAFDHDTYQRKSDRSNPTEYMQGYYIGNSAQDVSKIPLERNVSEDPDHLHHTHHHPFPMLSGKQSSNKHNDLWSSIDGAAAPYVADMSTFLQLQEAFLGCSNENSYRDILYSLYQDRTKLTIPVLFIKDMLSSQNLRSKCSSQVWKDLQRDIIVVNGEQISGELGAESMLGALVRHLNDKAEALRALQDKKHPETLRAKHLGDSMHCISTPQQKSISTFASSTSSSSTNNNSNNNTNNNKSLISVDFAISEAQIVECAKDLLVLCNRTQSGGDTYFCIEAFLSGDHMKEFCILTPYSAEAEPLEFKIDVVEVSQHLSPAVRRQQGLQNQGQDVHQSLIEVTSKSMSGNDYNASLGGVSSSTSNMFAANSGGAGEGVGGGDDNSYIEAEEGEGDIEVDDESAGLKRQQQLQSQRQLQLLHHHMHSPLANSAPSSSAASNQAQLQQIQLPSTPLPAPFIMRDIIDTAPSTSDFQHSPLTSSPPPMRAHPLSNSNSNFSLAKAAKNRSRKKSFTFEDVVLEGDLNHKKRSKNAKKVGKALLDTDDDNDEDDRADVDSLGNDRDDEKEEYDESEDDTDMYLSARSSHSKRTGLRLSGSGATGFLGMKNDDFANRYQAPPSPIVSPGDYVHGLYNNAIVGPTPSPPPPPPRRAQLNLKRELEKEGYLNSVWNSDGSSVWLQPSLFSQQQQFARYDQPLPPVPTKSISPFSSSRPDSRSRNSGGVAMGYLELPHDDDDSPVKGQPSHEATSDNISIRTTGDCTQTIASSEDNHSRPPSLSSSLPPLPPATIVSQQTTSSAVTQVAMSRPDDISVISELTFDTFLRNQRHGHYAPQLQLRSENNLQLSNHIDPASSLSSHSHSICNYNILTASQVPSNLHLPPFHYQYHQNYNNTYNHPHMNTRPTSSGQTTVSGQVSPDTNSQRTSGHHDALTTTTCSSNSNDHTVPLSSQPYITTVQYQQQQHQHHPHANHPQHTSHLSDGEEYGIMDDEGQESNSNNPDNTSGTASASKKKSLLKRFGKKLRPFKMPHMTSTAAHGDHNSAVDVLRSPFNSGPVTSRSRAPSDSGTPLAPTSTTHFQQFLQHLTPKHHNTNHHHHHHNESDKDIILSNGKHSHHKSHRHNHHTSSHNSHNPPLQSTSHSNNNSHQYGNLLQQAFHQGYTVHSSIDSNNNISRNNAHSDPAMSQHLPPRYGLRIQVRAKCRYRVCGANPTGFVDVDSWATVTGIFHQSFLLVGDGRSQLGITDRLVTIEIDGCTSPHQLTSSTPSVSLPSPFDNTDQPRMGLSTPSHR